MASVPFVISEGYGTVVARRPSAHPGIPGAILAAARPHDRQGWYVSLRAAHHLIYVPDEGQARALLAAVAGELA